MYCQGWTSQEIWLLSKFDLEGQGQLPPKTIRILTNVLCASGPNLGIPAWTGEELLCGQAQNGLNFYFEAIFDLEDQGQSPSKTIGIFHTYGPNLVIPAWTGDELSRGQARDYRTHRRTDGRTHSQTDASNDNTRRPKLASGIKYIPSIKYRFQSICPWEMQLLFQLCIFQKRIY